MENAQTPFTFTILTIITSNAYTCLLGSLFDKTPLSLLGLSQSLSKNLPSSSIMEGALEEEDEDGDACTQTHLESSSISTLSVENGREREKVA